MCSSDLYLGLTIFIALVVTVIAYEGYRFIMDWFIIRKRRKAISELNDKLISAYANVDDIDEFAKEWTGE